MFAIIFGLFMGPIVATISFFRNAMVFHDYARLTSVYVHLVPAIIVYM